MFSQPFRYDATSFLSGTEMVVDVKRSSGENSTQIRASLYTHWARSLKVSVFLYNVLLYDAASGI